MRKRRLTERSMEAYEARGAEKVQQVLRQQIKAQTRLIKLQNAQALKIAGKKEDIFTHEDFKRLLQKRREQRGEQQ